MRGLDGNYLNAQGDALSRIQVAYQSEQNRQQVQAQIGAQDALRRLREQVNESEETGTAHGPKVVGEDQGSGRHGENGDPLERDPKSKMKSKQESSSDLKKTAHIDIRV